MAKGSIVSELRAWREREGLTLEQAGARIVVGERAVDRATFHAWEAGKKTPKDAWMFEIERVTGVQPNAFYDRPEDIEPAAPARQGALM